MKKILFIMVMLGLFISVGAQQLIIEGPELLAKGEGSFHMPKISPDGNFVAFGGEDHNGIFITNFDGSGLKNLTTASAAGWNLQWSPNSDAIVTRVNFWTEDMRERATAVMLYNIDGEEVNLSGMMNDVSMPEWSRSGASVVWVDDNEQISSYVLRSDNDDEVAIAYSNKIVTRSKGESEVIAPVDGEYLFVRWSEDNSRAAISVAGKGVFVFDRRSGTIHDFGVGEYPSWIGNDYLVVMESKDDGYQITGGEVLLYRFDGTLIRNLTGEFDSPALFPDANNEGKVVFHTLEGAIYKLTIRNLR